MHPTRDITSRVDMVVPESQYYMEECTGIKTGYHSKAGQCFVGSAERGGRTIISVTLFSTRDYPERKWFDANCMFQYGFTCFDMYYVDDMFALGGDGINSITIENAAKDDPRGGKLDLILSQTTNDGYSVMVLKGSDELDNHMIFFRENTVITPTLDYLDKVENRQTIEAGSIVATFSTYTEQGETITGTLIASRTVEMEPFDVSIWDYLTELIPFLKRFEESGTWYILVSIIVLIVIVILVAGARKRKRERRRRRIYEQRRRAYIEKQRRMNRSSSAAAKRRRDPYDDV